MILLMRSLASQWKRVSLSRERSFISIAYMYHIIMNIICISYAFYSALYTNFYNPYKKGDALFGSVSLGHRVIVRCFRCQQQIDYE